MKGNETETAQDTGLTKVQDPPTAEDTVSLKAVMVNLRAATDTLLNPQVIVHNNPIRLAHVTPLIVPERSHHQVLINHATTKLQVTGQAPMHRVTANHQVTGSNRSQVIIDRRQCIRKLALTANVQLGKIKTSVRTATRKYNSHPIAPTYRSLQCLPTQDRFSIVQRLV
jgi:hypothetical protein